MIDDLRGLSITTGPGDPSASDRLLGVGVGVDTLSVETASPVVSFEQFLVPEHLLPPQPWAYGLPDWPARAGVRPLLIGVDLVACGAGLLAAGALNPVTALFAVLVIAANATGGLHRSRLAPALLDDLPQLTGRLLVVLALTTAAQLTASELSWAGAPLEWPLLTAAAVTLALSTGLRGASYRLVRFMRRTGRVRHRTVILGAGKVGRYLADVLLEHPGYGLDPIGFLDEADRSGPADPSPAHPVLAHPVLAHPVLGRPDELPAVLAAHGVRNVIVAFGSMPEPELVDVLRTCDRLDCEIFVVPRLFELYHAGKDLDTVWGIPLVRLRRAAQRSHGWQVKRAVDVLVAGLALPLLSPLLLVVAAAVRAETRASVIFRQERVGLDGRAFDLLKFRSLQPVSEAESSTTWSFRGTARLGPVGSFLRRTSLDELPQLVNVLKGDMSLVGPRPERPYFVATFLAQHPHYLARHRVPCGLTGLAQVNGLRGDTSIAERALFDNYYIENWSLWLDAKILLRTALSVVRAEGS